MADSVPAGCETHWNFLVAALVVVGVLASVDGDQVFVKVGELLGSEFGPFFNLVGQPVFQESVLHRKVVLFRSPGCWYVFALVFFLKQRLVTHFVFRVVGAGPRFT